MQSWKYNLHKNQRNIANSIALYPLSDILPRYRYALKTIEISKLSSPLRSEFVFVWEERQYTCKRKMNCRTDDFKWDVWERSWNVNLTRFFMRHPTKSAFGEYSHCIPAFESAARKSVGTEQIVWDATARFLLSGDSSVDISHLFKDCAQVFGRFANAK